MRKRKIRGNPAPSQNLDSFLDILTNTVGALMFIGLFLSLLSVQSGTTIKTPLRSETNKLPKFFEVRNEQLFYLSDSELDQKLSDFFNNLPRCTKPKDPDSRESYVYNYYLRDLQQYQQCEVRRIKESQNFYVDTGFYMVTFVNGKLLQYEPKLDVKGEIRKEFKQKDSRLNTILKDLDPNINYLAFIVRPDSFSTFRAARDQAKKKGFDVGWEPLPEDSMLIFGSGNRPIGIQ